MAEEPSKPARPPTTPRPVPRREIEFILRKAPAALAYLDRNQRYRYVNERFVAFFRLQPEQAIGKLVNEVVGDDFYALVAPGIEAALAGQTNSRVVHAPGPDGKQHWLHGRHLPHVVDGEVQGCIIMTSDITSTKLAEQALETERLEYLDRLERVVDERTAQTKELQRRLAEAERVNAAEEMAAAVAHAVNNPLAALLGTVEMAQRGMLPAAEALDRTRWLANRIQGVIEGTLRMFQRGQVDLRPESPATLLEHVKLELAPRALKRNIEIHLAIQPELPRILVDRNLLGSALMCIAENALHASPEGSNLWLSAAPLDGGSLVQLRISDEGCGIPPHLKAKVLQPFFTTKKGGTGLGLAIAMGVVHGHGGSLRIEDRSGGGTTVTIDLLREGFQPESWNPDVLDARSASC